MIVERGGRRCTLSSRDGERPIFGGSVLDETENSTARLNRRWWGGFVFRNSKFQKLNKMCRRPGMKFRWMTVALVLFAAVAARAQDVDIPYQKFVLENGLTVIVHEDHKAPIVAVNTSSH